MGQISKKLARHFTKWSGRFRQGARTVPIPKDVRDVETLVKDGHDPLHAVYISVQNITSVFAECVSVLPELEPYYDVIAAAEDEYMPDAPPISPLTRSYFTTWAFFDVRFGPDQETIGTWLRRHGQSDRAIERFWSVVLLGALGERVERASLAAARKVFADGFLASREAYELEVPKLWCSQGIWIRYVASRWSPP